jgi:hypothetical protein
MLFLPSFSRSWRCNAGATLICVLLPAAVLAQAIPPPDAGGAAAQPPAEHRLAVDAAVFLLGAGAALGVHEGGHVLFDAIFDAGVDVKSIHFGPVPFFAVSHRAGLPPREEVVISSAGFWTQEATAEWLLTKRPGLRHEHAPFAKGALAFDTLTSIGYGTVAMFKAGPPERDTRGVAATGIDERVVGAFVIAPAVLDGYRYFHPDAAWAKWASRAAKAATVLLVVKGR